MDDGRWTMVDSGKLNEEHKFKQIKANDKKTII